MSNLVIVESPAKAKTINKYLGKDFEVVASYGHVRDLVPKEGAVNTETFDMKYHLIAKNKKHIDEITKSFKNHSALYLATDPDREGEAISWHVCEILKKKKLLKDKPVYRIVFYEITQNAVEKALESPRDISMELINAQQARRALDYLVGFNLSPLLWKKIRRGLSAGRVQSPALRMIVEREYEIENFEKQEYWSIIANCLKSKQNFNAQLTHLDNKKLKQFDISTKEQAEKIKQQLLTETNKILTVKNIEKKQRKKYPLPPFITSTLQQDASRKLGFSAQKTMRIAQQLYEGVDTGEGSTGLITYMRTDSTALAQDALKEIRQFIKQSNAEYLPEKAVFYKTKSKNAQEAHEAVRPTSIFRNPEKLKNRLNKDQYRLYDLIWKRTIASQMTPAIINTLAVDLITEKNSLFRATGSSIAKPGYLSIYKVGTDDNGTDNDENMLPEMKVNEKIELSDIDAQQHFTKPPARYTEASLIKTLEDYGIGRPSTYASIISTLMQREYVELEEKRFKPTDVGRIVNKFLTEHFTKYVDYEFTAQLEDQLDAIARGENQWKPVMKEFWESFSKQIDEKEKIPRKEVIEVKTLGKDPKSGKPVSVRMARYGPVVQIGTADDDEKPEFASLKPNQSMENITLQEALKLFELPRILGKDEKGQEILVNIGKYGPYIRIGKKFVSLGQEDPHSVTLDKALEIIAENEDKKNNRIIKDFKDSNIQVLNGPYGPYISDGKKNVRMPKGKQPADLTLKECQELIEKAPQKKRRFRKR